MQLNQLQRQVTQASQPESRGSKHMGNVTLQKFEGRDQNPIKFWSLFIQYCTLYRFTESETVGMFPLHVSSTVQDWFYLLEEGVRRNLQRLKEAFLERFQRRNLEYSLQHIKQNQSESVNDYINRILAQTSDSSVPEAILVSMIVGGLRPDLTAIVMPQVPKTHQQFLAAASTAEKTVQMTKAKPIENLTLQVANIASMEDRLSAMLTDKLSSSVAEISAIQAHNNNQSNGPYQRQNYQQRPKTTFQQRNYQRPSSSSCQGCAKSSQDGTSYSLPDVEGNPGSAKLLRPHPKSWKVLKEEAKSESHDETHVTYESYRVVKMNEVTLLLNVVVKFHNLQDIKCDNPNFELTTLIKYGPCVKCIYKCTECKFTSPCVNLFDEIQTSKRVDLTLES
ncbi:Hypothetical predicted protein [Mytilus galloprovincialis]|uniref:Retrotransposon gag domain-containing protein n=1 Tax=Mytilus galloprovincialis TaxID=29158 RepID=A0A8B6BG83_MYTGA|nr:Hypothetical predicted protein [Mytilus galloprovincialis]